MKYILLLVLVLLTTLSNLQAQEVFRKEKFTKNKLLSNALKSDNKKFLEIEMQSESGLQEWITINPDNGDTVLYKALLNENPLGRWKGYKAKEIVTKIDERYSSIELSTTQFEMYERKFDLLKYDSLPNISRIPDSVGVYSSDGDSFQMYIVRNIAYPKEAKDKNVQGTVYAQLMLDNKGVLHFEGIKKGVNPYLEVEIIRLVENCPRWYAPAKTKGESVGYNFIMPFNWKLR